MMTLYPHVTLRAVRICILTFSLVLFAATTGCDQGEDSQSVDVLSDVCESSNCALQDVSSEPNSAPAEDTSAGPEIAPPVDLVPDPGLVPVDLVVPDEVAVDVDDGPEMIVIPISDLSTTATFFEFDAHTATVKFFAVLDGSGSVHVAFDACDVCYGAKLGYSQQGDMMICNSCGNAFSITGIGTENRGGGCWPGYLEITVTESDVIIDPEVLKAGAWYFE